MNRLNLIALAGAIALLAAGALWMRHDARQDLKHEIEEQNDDAGNAADDAALGRRECVAGGGVWDFGSGRCRRP
jgi:hypothetical protein